MTRAELAEELGVKESYLAARWKDVVKNRAKIDVELVKIGRGDAAEYGIKGPKDTEVRYEHLDGELFG